MCVWFSTDALMHALVHVCQAVGGMLNMHAGLVACKILGLHMHSLTPLVVSRRVTMQPRLHLNHQITRQGLQLNLERQLTGTASGTATFQCQG